MRTSRKTDFRKLKITLVTMTYQPTPSVSLSVPSCSLGLSDARTHTNLDWAACGKCLKPGYDAFRFHLPPRRISQGLDRREQSLR